MESPTRTTRQGSAAVAPPAAICREEHDRQRRQRKDPAGGHYALHGCELPEYASVRTRPLDRTAGACAVACTPYFWPQGGRQGYVEGTPAVCQARLPWRPSGPSSCATPWKSGRFGCPGPGESLPKRPESFIDSARWAASEGILRSGAALARPAGPTRPVRSTLSGVGTDHGECGPDRRDRTGSVAPVRKGSASRGPLVRTAEHESRAPVRTNAVRGRTAAQSRADRRAKIEQVAGARGLSGAGGAAETRRAAAPDGLGEGAPASRRTRLRRGRNRR